MDNNRPVTILLVEDDLGHASLIKKNLKRAGINNALIHLTDGQQAVDFLFGTGEYEGNKPPKPMLVLLDINMPVLDGHETLKIIKGNASTKNIPIIVLTTSATESEVNSCYELGCNVFVKKPVEYEEFAQAIKNLGMFIQIMMLPDNK